MRILVAEANRGYAELIEDVCRFHADQAVVATSLKSAAHFLERSPVDLMVLSTSITGAHPSSLVRALRQHQDLPLVLLYEELDDPEMVECLDAGADDCIRLPFHPRELHARFCAVMRRYPAVAPVMHDLVTLHAS